MVMEKIEYLKAEDGVLYAYVDGASKVVVYFDGEKWFKSKKTIDMLEAEKDSFNISSVEAMAITQGISAEEIIESLKNK